MNHISIKVLISSLCIIDSASAASPSAKNCVARLGFPTILNLPHQERLAAIVAVTGPENDDIDERTANNHQLATLVDFSGCFSTAEDVINCVKTFQRESKPFDINAIAGLNSSEFRRESLLHKAADKGDVQLIQFLVTEGAPIDVQDGRGWTPLHHAVWNSRANAVQALIALNANAHAHDEDGRTPLELKKEPSGAPGSIARVNDSQIIKILSEIPAP